MKKRCTRKHWDIRIRKIQKKDIRRAQKEGWWRGYNLDKNIHYRLKMRFRAYHLTEPKEVSLCAVN